MDAAERESHTAYIFPTLELRRSRFLDGDYERTELTEAAHLFVNEQRIARVVFEPSAKTVPERQDGHTETEYGRGSSLHVFFSIAGSTNVTIDQATSELVEHSTYFAYGATESDYRPERWGGYRADYKFTGKEEDVEVGLQYFGKRYLSSMLGRWTSADPLALHQPGAADLNLYAYVSGQVLRSIDPTGLVGMGGSFEDHVIGAAADVGGKMSLDGLQMSLDLMSIAAEASVVGEPVALIADLFNAGISAGRGDWVGAGLSLSGAVPVLGNAANAVRITRTTAKMVKEAKVAEATLTTAKTVTNVAETTTTTAKLAEGVADGTKTVDDVMDQVLPFKWGPGCFVAGTTVWTPHGEVPIESIEVGDVVLALHESAEGELRWQTVLATKVGEPTAILDIEIASTDISQGLGVTPEHPFWRKGDGWVEAGDLGIGDLVWTANRGWLTVRSIHERPQQEPVYNLSVSTDRTFFVGGAAVWVHNNDCAAGGGVDGVVAELKRPSGVSDADWNAKMKKLNEGADAGDAKMVHKPTRDGKAQQAARKNGEIEAGHDADHGLDLQFGGKDTRENITSTNARVNRSVGGQGTRLRKEIPDGTKIKEFVTKQD